MALDPRAQAVLALHRFGWPPRRNDFASAAQARDALIAEIENPLAGRIDKPDLSTSAEAARAVFDFQQQRRTARLAAAEAQRNARQEERGQCAGQHGQAKPPASI